MEFDKSELPKFPDNILPYKTGGIKRGELLLFVARTTVEKSNMRKVMVAKERPNATDTQ